MIVESGRAVATGTGTGMGMGMGLEMAARREGLRLQRHPHSIIARRWTTVQV